MELNFHDLFTVDLRKAHESVKKAFDMAYPVFVDENPGNAPGDIVIEPLHPDSFPESVFVLPKKVAPFYAAHDEERTYLVFRHKGKVDALAELQDQIRLCYVRRRGIEKKVLWIFFQLVQVLLNRKGGMLCHGAVACRADVTLVLTGIGGASKTTLLLNLLDEGWSYLSDNTFILLNGNAYMFRKAVCFNYYHLKQMPAMFRYLKKPADRRRADKCRKIRGLAEKTLPYKILTSQKLKRLYDPYLSAEPEELFPWIDLRFKSRPTHWVILRPGAAASPISRKTGASFFQAVQGITDPDTNEIRNLLTLSGYLPPDSFSDFFEKKQAGLIFQFSVPHGADPREQYFRFTRFLSSTSHFRVGEKNDSLTTSVVIPTYNRPKELKNCLESLVGQTLLPDEIVIVDDGDLGKVPLSEKIKRKNIALKYRKKDSPGLTESRNAGIAMAKGDIVFFLDDDVELFHDYIERIVNVYRDDVPERVMGVGGMIANPKPATPARRLRYLYDVFFLNRGFSEGKVLPSGFCTDYNTSWFPVVKVKKVDFLDGGVCSYRKKVFERFKFTDRYRNLGLGEDKDFSYRVARRHALCVNPRARLNHYESTAMRPDKFNWGRKFLVGRYMFFMDHVKRRPWHGLAFAHAVVGYVVARIAIAAFSGKKDEWKRVAGILSAVRDIVSGRIEWKEAE